MGEATVEIPRLKWLKRLVALYLLVFLGFAAFHWWLWRAVDRRIETIVEGWRQEGAPLPEDALNATGIATGTDNAAFYYQQAINALPRLTQRQIDEWDNWFGQTRPLPQEKAPIVREIVEQNRQWLDLAREARSHDRIDWGQPAITMATSPNWSGARELAIRLDWAASLAYHDGDVASAAAYGSDLGHLGISTVHYGPSIVAGLVSSGICALGNANLLEMAWHPPPGITPEQEREAWREAGSELDALIDHLLNESEDQAVRRLSWQGERVSVHSAIPAMAVAAPTPTASSLFLWPVMKADIADLLEAESEIARAAISEDPAAVMEVEFFRRQPETMAGTVATFLTSILTPTIERSNLTFLRIAAERRMTAVLLASKRFHMDQGRWPVSLEELTPRYLPRVPADPFARDGRLLGFRTDTLVPIVYSVGDDFEDDGGSTAPPATATRREQQRLRTLNSPHERADLVYPLHLPEAYALFPSQFNVWNYLRDPMDELERAREATMEAEKAARDIAEAQAEESPQRMPGELDVEDQERQPQRGQDEQERPAGA